MRRLLRLALPLGILVTLAVTGAANAQVTHTTKTDGPITLEFSSPTGSDRQNTDMAFWGNTLVQGDTRGIRIFDISNPDEPQLLSDFPCNGAYGDVSIWGTLVFRSVDIPQDSDGCGSVNTTQTVTQGGPGSQTTNLPYEIYQTIFSKYEYGEASAAGVVVVILTIIVATFALRVISGLFKVEEGR